MASLDEKIELVDKNKVVRIRLGIDDKGSPYLSLNDADGRERVIVSVDREGNGSLGFRTAKGQPILSLGVSSTRGAGVMVLDVQSKTCLTLEIADSGGQIRLDTKQGVHVWPAPIASPQPTEGDDIGSGREEGG